MGKEKERENKYGKREMRKEKINMERSKWG